MKGSPVEEYEELSNNQENLLENARAELSRDYVAQQTSQSTRVIGFAAGIFTLVSVVSTQERLSKVFPEGSGIIIPWQPPQWLGFWVFYGAVALLMFFVTRTMFRFTVFGYLTVYVKSVTQRRIENARGQYKKDHPQEEEPTLISMVQRVTYDLLRHAKRRSFTFPTMWFLPTSENSREWKLGVLVCALFALVFSAILIGLIW